MIFLIHFHSLKWLNDSSLTRLWFILTSVPKLFLSLNSLNCIERGSDSRPRRTALSVSYSCIVLPEFSGKFCLVSACCSDSDRTFCQVGIFSWFDSVRCADSVRILEKSCPLSICPAKQGRDRAVRTFTVLVRRRLPDRTSKFTGGAILNQLIEGRVTHFCVHKMLKWWSKMTKKKIASEGVF